jgi:acyl-coenzyme A thioesterase PaaI-like protein
VPPVPAPQGPGPHAPDARAPAGRADHPLLRATRGWGRVETDPRRLQARELADELRRIIDHLVQTDAPLADLEEATTAAHAFADRLAALPRRRAYEGIAEASIADPREQAFFDHSPIMGLANPVAPPLVVTDIRAGGLGEGEERPTVEATVRMAWSYEGPPASVHGGWVAALFDDVLGLAQGLTGNPGFTGTLTIKYRSPTPLDTDLDFRAWVDRVEGRKIFALGTCHAGDVLCAEAEGIFISVPPERVTAMMEHRRTTSRPTH